MIFQHPIQWKDSFCLKSVQHFSITFWFLASLERKEETAEMEWTWSTQNSNLYDIVDELFLRLYLEWTPHVESQAKRCNLYYRVVNQWDAVERL